MSTLLAHENKNHKYLCTAPSNFTGNLRRKKRNRRLALSRNFASTVAEISSRRPRQYCSLEGVIQSNKGYITAEKATPNDHNPFSKRPEAAEAINFIKAAKTNMESAPFPVDEIPNGAIY